MSETNDNTSLEQTLTEKMKTWFTPVFSEILAKRLMRYDSDVQNVISYEFLPGSIYGSLTYVDSENKEHEYRINPNPTS